MNILDKEKEFKFEDANSEIIVEIGSYADDPDSIGEFDRYYDEELLHNCVTWRGGYYDKINDSHGFDCHEMLMLISDIIAMRKGVNEFRERKIDRFGPFPRIGVGGEAWPYFFQIKLLRKGKIDICATTVYDITGANHVRTIVSDEWLMSLGAWLSCVADKYPLRPFVESHGK